MEMISTKQSNKLCAICGVKTDGIYRNGTMACKACKSFFLMYCLEANELKCRNGTGDCMEAESVVSPSGTVWRHMCRKCRFEKCVRMGMWSKKANDRQIIQQQQKIPPRIDSLETINSLTGMDGISEIDMTEFDLFLNTGWTTMAGNVKQYDLSQIGLLMNDHSQDVIQNAVRFFSCSPALKGLNTQLRCLIVTKCMVRVVMFAVAFNLGADQAPIGASGENFKTMTTYFPAYKVTTVLFDKKN